ncbi:molybdopterin-dependent oxidoreductase [Frankia nepalensis]|uniref:Molybdopterin-dependent oxidoreductase n=1 Tax=Frankia nepalensis TaxID=1836974 RepID=A0A937RK67_9ACTN|nr:molybdopterin-dependent oxidoreductase [Frankia nepalensis]MBL7497392.1 molybdopterin-dependent oxidoreductase [Frankia nepalensis]MBL7512095.1 molybdopterin-dependent oxidoreductase [Frankia nepalensis]MBL7631805.1 molybdopterin-dependent oxidoreductase [Frankia nepalensis]
MAAEVEHRATCPLCEAMCGLRITTVDDQVRSIRGNADDVWSRGYICPKGTALGHLHSDPDRLRQPMVRGADGIHRPVGWDEAWAEVERVLRPVLQEDGAGALTVYVGNPVAHNLDLVKYIGALVGMASAAGMKAIYTPGTVDQWPLNLVSALLFGGMWAGPVPDLARTDHLVILGANPSASQGSMLSAPDMLGRLKAIRARGGRVLVVDPRRTRTAEAAGEWLPIRPGTDALLLFAVLRTLADEGLVRRPAHLDGLVSGLDEVLALAAPFTPERVAAACGIPAEQIRGLARDLAAARAPALYGRIGTCTQEFGTLATWLIFVLNVALGSLDAPGGVCFPRAAAWMPGSTRAPDQTGERWEFHRYTSRVRKAPEVFGQFPVSCLAEEIDTPGAGRLRALISVAGNPVISAPGSARLDAALPRLDAFIAVDNWLNETTRHAHVILPGLSPLERGHADDLYWMYAVESAFKWNGPVLPAPAGRPAEWEILLRLAGTVLGMPAPDVDLAALDDLYTTGIITVATRPGQPLAGRDPAEILPMLHGRGPARLVDLGVRAGPFGDRCGERPDGWTLEKARRHPDGIAFGPLRAGRLAEVLQTPSGTVELVHDLLVRDVGRLTARLERAEPELVLTSRRHLRSNNSWLHNVPALNRGTNRCTLLIHPLDAARAGLADGQPAEVSTAQGRLSVPVEVSDEMMPGVVSLPHGWGHGQAGTRLTVAATRPGINSNLLNPGDVLDIPSGTIVLNGVPCQVHPARTVDGQVTAAP